MGRIVHSDKKDESHVSLPIPEGMVDKLPQVIQNLDKMGWIVDVEHPENYKVIRTASGFEVTEKLPGEVADEKKQIELAEMATKDKERLESEIKALKEQLEQGTLDKKKLAQAQSSIGRAKIIKSDEDKERSYENIKDLLDLKDLLGDITQVKRQKKDAIIQEKEENRAESGDADLPKVPVSASPRDT